MNEKKIIFDDGDDFIVFERYAHGNGDRWCLYHEEFHENDWGEEEVTKHGYIYNLLRSDVDLLAQRITEDGGYNRIRTEYDAE
jgi:hypothetical protein